jgi:hypothetical protein
MKHDSSKPTEQKRSVLAKKKTERDPADQQDRNEDG